jgi:transposase
MRIHNRIPIINNKWIRNINPEINYLKNEEVIKRKKSYESFKLLLEKNKHIKNIKERLSYKEIQEILGISRATYYRIKKELKMKGTTYWQILESDIKNNSKNRRPKNFRQSLITQETKQLILKIRLDNPTYGKDKLKKILERDYNLTLSTSSITRILTQLNERKLIGLKGSKIKRLFDVKKDKPKPRDFKDKYAQPFNYEVQHISNKRYFINKTTGKKIINRINNIDNITEGELIQIDHLKINKNDKRFIQVNAVDPITRIKTSYCYSSATSKNTKEFLLKKLIPNLPFPIKSIQVDGGSEFRLYFEEACKMLNIRLYVLPPHTPKNNGRVERVNQTDRKEFWNNNNNSIGSCNDLWEFNEKLEEYTYKYNHYRPHSALDYLTPIEYYNKLVNMRQNCLRCV